jgi:hypothetical protein
MLWALIQSATHNMPSGNQPAAYVFSDGLDAIPHIISTAVRKNITRANKTMPSRPVGGTVSWLTPYCLGDGSDLTPSPASSATPAS